MGLKYIMFDVQIGSIKKQIPIIFPDVLVHFDVAKALKDMMESKYRFEAEVVSSGKINIEVFSVSGASETLGVASNTEDVITINDYDYFHGVR